jgi:hypothetical protein
MLYIIKVLLKCYIKMRLGYAIDIYVDKNMSPRWLELETEEKQFGFINPETRELWSIHRMPDCSYTYLFTNVRTDFNPEKATKARCRMDILITS